MRSSHGNPAFNVRRDDRGDLALNAIRASNKLKFNFDNLDEKWYEPEHFHFERALLPWALRQPPDQFRFFSEFEVRPEKPFDLQYYLKTFLGHEDVYSVFERDHLKKYFTRVVKEPRGVDDTKLEKFWVFYMMDDRSLYDFKSGILKFRTDLITNKQYEFISFHAKGMDAFYFEAYIRNTHQIRNSNGDKFYLLCFRPIKNRFTREFNDGTCLYSLRRDDHSFLFNKSYVFELEELDASAIIEMDFLFEILHMEPFDFQKGYLVSFGRPFQPMIFHVPESWVRNAAYDQFHQTLFVLGEYVVEFFTYDEIRILRKKASKWVEAFDLPLVTDDINEGKYKELSKRLPLLRG